MACWIISKATLSSTTLFLDYIEPGSWFFCEDTSCWLEWNTVIEWMCRLVLDSIHHSHTIYQFQENLLSVTLVTVVIDGSLLTMVIFGSSSITISFTTGFVSIRLYSVITWSPSTTIVSTFGPVSVTRVTLLIMGLVLKSLISGPRTRRKRCKTNGPT